MQRNTEEEEEAVWLQRPPAIFWGERDCPFASLSFSRVLCTQAFAVRGGPGGVSLCLFQVCICLKKEPTILFFSALCFNNMAQAVGKLMKPELT